MTECGRSVEPRILPLHSGCSMRFEANVNRGHLTALESVDSGHRMTLNSWPLSGSLLISMNVMKRPCRRWPPACNLIGSLRHGRTSAHTNVYDRFWSLATTPSPLMNGSYRFCLTEGGQAEIHQCPTFSEPDQRMTANDQSRSFEACPADPESRRS